MSCQVPLGEREEGQLNCEEEELYDRLAYTIHMPQEEDFYLDIPPAQVRELAMGGLTALWICVTGSSITLAASRPTSRPTLPHQDIRLTTPSSPTVSLELSTTQGELLN